MTLKSKIINVVTVTLLTIGVGSGLVILYDYIEGPHLVSKDQAFELATRAGNWSQNFLADKTLEIKLMHVKTKSYRNS